MKQRIDDSSPSRGKGKQKERATRRAKRRKIKLRAAVVHGNHDLGAGWLGHHSRICIEALRGSEAGAESRLRRGFAGIRFLGWLRRSRGSKNRQLEIVRVIHSRNVRPRVQYPENLVAWITVITDKAVSRQLKIHGYGAPKRPRLHGTGRNILFGLPERYFAGAVAVSGTGDDPPDATEAHVDAVGRLRFKAQLDPAGQALAGRDRQGIKFEIRVSKALVPDSRANGVHEQNDPKGAET